MLYDHNGEPVKPVISLIEALSKAFFKIVVHGKQTHGAYPWLGVDPIVVAAQIILGLQTIPSRQVDSSLAPSIVTVGQKGW